jgi:TM2 domain-containing membrane protein YozV
MDKLFNQPKTRKLGVILALLGAVTPLSGIHKFYLGQPIWGVIYLLLWHTPIAQIACAIEAVWFVIQDQQEFYLRFNLGDDLQIAGIKPSEVNAIADALRQLDQLRLDGLITEWEFEEKRRKLIDHIV